MPAIDGQHNLIQRPLVSTAGLPTVPLVGEPLAELQAPPANGLVGDEDPRAARRSSTSRWLNVNRKYSHTAWLTISAG